MKKAVVAVSVLLAAAIWLAALLLTQTTELTVVRTERHLTVNDIQQRDCYVIAVDSNGKQNNGYAASSRCTSLKPGDKVRISDGFLQ